MRLSKLGISTSKVEILDILVYGIWLYVHGREYFLPYEKFPWFKEAKISEIHNVKSLSPQHLYWPDLDVDLELDSLKYPEYYPLIYK